MFTPFHKALLALVAVGFFAVAAAIWTRGAAGLAAPTAAGRAALVSPATALSQNAPPPGILAIGEASVRAVADSAYVAFAVQASGPVGTDLAAIEIAPVVHPVILSTTSSSDAVRSSRPRCRMVARAPSTRTVHPAPSRAA